MTHNNETKNSEVVPNLSKRPPNETGTITVEGFIKIFDPNSKETFVEKRA